MIQSALNWIRQKLEAIRERRASPKDPIGSTSDGDAADARKKFSDALESFSDFFGNLARSFHETTQLQRFIVVGESFRKSGYFAGQWGIREPEIDKIADMQVRITRSLIDEECQSSQRKLTSQVEILETIKKNAERDYDAKNGYYEKLNRAYQYNHRQFSLLLGVIYSFFAFVLVLADIPLALELTKEGLNLKSDETSAIRDLFAYGTEEGFVMHFIKVLTVNWEVVLFATGVAFCTIYIKIFYDDFIGVPLENLIKKASESPRADYEELHLAETRQTATNGTPAGENQTANKKDRITGEFDRLWWWRFRVKLFVLVILFATIVVLGFFRYSVTRWGVGEVPPVVMLFTYTSLTLLFPIVSGICASLALNCFHNWRERRKAETQNRDARAAVITATDEYRVKKEEQERNSGFIAWLAKDETVPQLTQYLVRCYNSGFKFGYLHPEWSFGGDLFTRAEALRNRNLTDPSSPLSGAGSVKPVQVSQTAVN